MGKRKKQRVAIEIAVNTSGRLIIEARTDIIDHPYIMAIDVWELEKPGEEKKRRTRLISPYNNNLRANQVWRGVESNTRHRTLANAEWDRILGGRVVLLGHFKAYSP